MRWSRQRLVHAGQDRAPSAKPHAWLAHALVTDRQVTVQRGARGGRGAGVGPGSRGQLGRRGRARRADRGRKHGVKSLVREHRVHIEQRLGRFSLHTSAPVATAHATTLAVVAYMLLHSRMFAARLLRVASRSCARLLSG